MSDAEGGTPEPSTPRTTSITPDSTSSTATPPAAPAEADAAAGAAPAAAGAGLALRAGEDRAPEPRLGLVLVCDGETTLVPSSSCMTLMVLGRGWPLADRRWRKVGHRNGLAAVTGMLPMDVRTPAAACC